MSFFLTLFINLLYLLMEYFAFPGIHFIFCYLGRAIFFAQIMSHAHTVFFNPGIPSMSLYLSDRVVDFILKNSEENKSVFNKYRICKKCNILIKLEDSIVHCEECGICLIGIFI